MRSVSVLAPAKLNFALDIKGILENGYHEMDMIMQAVNLYDTVVLRKSNNLRVFLPNSLVPANKFNTAYKAAIEFFYYTGLLAGVDITIFKQIPVRAGMAGGSADAAAVLVGLNELYNAGLTQTELCEIGAKIGADVPFSIIGGTARVKGIGEKLQPLRQCMPCHICVCMPPKGISTKEAFARFDRYGAKTHPDCALAQEALIEGDFNKLCRSMYNVLQECSESEYNNILCQKLKDFGAKAAFMTGSGAAVFGVFLSKKQAAIAKKELSRDYNSWVLHPVAHGAKVI